MRGSQVLTLLGAFAASSIVETAYADVFEQTNLVSDSVLSAPAQVQDPNLINPWGIAEGPTTPFWVSDNGTGLATIYRVNGGTVSIAPLVVTIPGPGGATAAPTGQVFNGFSGGFDLTNGNGRPATFIFHSEDGIISGWNGGTNAVVAVPNTSGTAVYKGLAIDDTSGTLFAANFNSGKVEMYNSSFGLIKSFTVTTLPTGYAPFDVKVIGTQLYVTFALQNAAKHDDVAGPGNGFVDVFDLSGNFVKRLVSNGALNSPWGLQIAPSTFGQFAGDLLVGNFGDGRINAYNATTGAFIGTLDGTDGQPIDIPDLWGLAVGNGAMGGGSPNTLYFTSGLVDEGQGLFGSLSAVPEPSTWAMMLLGFAGLGFAGCRRARRRVAVRAD
jgi:uncharacterized protein (TIGR03118 family)